MTQFTASEVRDEADFGGDLRLRHKMLYAYADLLEARERAVPVMVVNHVSSAEHDLPIGMKLYAHPVPSDADRLAEAMRNGLIDALRHQRQIDEDGAEVGVSRQAIDEAAAILSALAAHYAQSQPPAASATPNLASYWRIVAEAAEVLQMVLDSGVKLPPNWRGPLLDELSGLSAMMLAAALQPQAVQPVAWVNPDDLHNPNFVGVNAVKVGHEGLGKHYTLPLYTHPQPAQDAALYQELLMAVSKKFPNESRHETALRYIKQTELQSCEPKCDAAMAKESGR